jgi:hypothetical protein
MKKIKKQQKKVAPKKVQEPIGTRIVKAVYTAKKISERIFGYISYNIKFVKATYTGKTQRPAKITAIEKGIVGILLVDETTSFERIGTILGLDVVNDKAEQAILRTAITTLQSFNAIEGDDSCLALTDGGRAYAEKGERPDSYTKSFDILVDTAHPTWLNIKNCLGDNVKAIEEINTPCDNLNLDLEQIKAYAEYQAQDVHYPQNRYLLESATWNEGHKASYKVYVCFVQNVATNEVRTFVYDEKQEGLNELIAEQINKDNNLKAELLSNCIRMECENNEDTEVLEGEAVDAAIAEIPVELKEAEQQMIKEEEDAEKTIENLEENRSVSVRKTSGKDRLHKKALYDSLSFEIELQKIFKEDNPDEIWLISPWIKGVEKNKHSVFVNQRGPEIERFLQDENKRVFVAYSAPSQTKSGKVKIDEHGNVIKNIDDDVLQLAMTLEEQYPNFFFVELPEFHVKNVIEVKADQQILFTGSFNVLSFSVSQEQTHIRREEMTLAHYSVAKKKYVDYLYEFAEIYAERIKKQIVTLDDSLASTYKNERLDYFLMINNSEIHKLFLPIEELLEEKSIANTKRELKQKLAKFGQELVADSNMSGLNPKDKKRIENSLANIEIEMKNNSIDDPAMMELFNNNKELLGKILEKKIFPGHSKESYVKNVAKTENKTAVEKKESSTDTLDKIPEVTEDGLALYIARLSQSFINREIGKHALNTSLKELIKNPKLVDLLEVISVVSSKNNNEAFDLSLGIKGYLFKFPTLFRKRELFEAVQKSSNKKWLLVYPTNINSIVNKLL